MFNKRHILTDRRFLQILEILLAANKKSSAIYLLRLVIGLKLTTAKKFLDKIDKFILKSTNPLQVF
jgi:ribosomal protein L7/L12